MAMIDVDRLSKRYGSFEAVRELSFQVEQAEVVGFLGPNGAGKSTTLRILAGFLGASGGSVRIAGHDVAEERDAARRAIGYMPESCPLYPEMRVDEYLRFRAELKRVPRRARKREVARVMEAARVSELSDVRIAHLSKGYRQRVGLGDALLGSPPLLILDEPTSGLDPNQIREVRALIRELSADHTVLLSTHILSEVEASCSRALIIANGKLVAEGSLEAIRAQAGDPHIELWLGDGAERAGAVLEALACVERFVRVGSEGTHQAYRVEVAANDERGLASAAEHIASALCKADVGLRRLAQVSPSLEQVFAELTEPAAPPEETAP